jgi:hypothetical protein
MAAAAAPDPREAESEAPFFIPEDFPPTVIMPPPSPVMAEPEEEPPSHAPVPAGKAVPPTIIMPATAEPYRLEPETAAAPAPAARPSKEDQAALDALFNAPAIQAPSASPERRPGKGEGRAPAFGQKPQARGRQTRGPSAVALGGITVVLVAAAAGIAWYLWGEAATRAGTKQAARPAATPMPMPSAMPATPVPASIAPAIVPSPRTTLPPSPTAPARSGPPSLAEARAFLKSGDLEQAARGFTANVKAAAPGSASVQLLVACSPETVQKAVQNAGSPELFIIPVNYKGRDCYRLCWGIYESAARAASEMRTLPEYFRKGATPRFVSTAEIAP